MRENILHKNLNFTHIFVVVQNANETHSRIHFTVTQYGLWPMGGIQLHVIWWSVINNSNEKSHFSMSSLYNITHFVCLQKEKGIDKVHLELNKLKSNVNTEWTRNFLPGIFVQHEYYGFAWYIAWCITYCRMFWNIETKIFTIEVKKNVMAQMPSFFISRNKNISIQQWA